MKNELYAELYKTCNISVSFQETFDTFKKKYYLCIGYVYMKDGTTKCFFRELALRI